MLKNLSIVFILFLFVSCSKIIEPEKPEMIFEKYKGSVVLVASEFYYEVYVGNATYYYSPSANKTFFFTKDDILKNLSFSTGTGFIISENGEIITNNHVVNHKDETFKDELINLYDEAKTSLINEIKNYTDTLDNIEASYNQYVEQLTAYDKENYVNKYQSVKAEKEHLIETYEEFSNTNLSNATSKLIIHRLGIAYNDTHITEFNDLQQCVVVKLSNNQDIDLALIQTKNKAFDVKPKFIFNFADNNPNIKENPDKTKERDIKNPIKINEDVFMIGFNRGFSLANTKQGIKSQFTSGKISQENDGERILYTIPTLEGSSGSPIVDKWGNLVAVNFAKMSNSQSFSFGIPVYELKKFYEQ